MNTDIEIKHEPDLLAMIEHDEGFRGKIYKDTEGLNTIGIGFCLDRREMPKEVAYHWLDYIIDEIIEELALSDKKRIFTGLDQPRQFAIINMCYQMGVQGVMGFRNMWGSLEQGDYESAAEHALDSRWYRQTPNRAKRIAQVISTGSLEPYKNAIEK